MRRKSEPEVRSGPYTIFRTRGAPQVRSILTGLLLCAALAWCGSVLAQDAGNGTTTPTATTPAATTPTAPPEPIQGELKLTQSFAVEGSDQDPTKQPTVGTRLVLTLKVTHPAGTIVALPDAQKTGRFELITVERQPLPVGVDPIEETIRMIFAVYRPGRHTLKSQTLSVLDPQGRISTIMTKPIEVRIMSVMADVKDPQMPTIKAPVTVWHEDWTLVWILSAAGLLLFGALIGAWINKRLRPPPEPPPGPPPRPAFDVAMEKLKQIENDALVGEEQFEEFYVRVSETLREYLGRRYNLSLTDQAGLELTTSEIVALLSEIRWPRGLNLMAVEEFFYDCDIVKFARYTPSAKECQDLLDRSFNMVVLTRPVTESASTQDTTTDSSVEAKPAVKVEESKAEETKTKEPDAEETKAEEPKSEEPEAKVLETEESEAEKSNLKALETEEPVAALDEEHPKDDVDDTARDEKEASDG